MKLAKALKLKNKLLKEYNVTLSRTISSNCYDVDTQKVYNSAVLLEEAILQRDRYVTLKAAIHSTSEPIRKKIFELGELKSFLSKFESLNTREGIVKDSNYNGTTVKTYAADISEQSKQEIIKSLEESIENIQEEIDSFNATTDLVGF
jgi:hypothetical protein